MDPEKAVQAASDLLGEIVIFSVKKVEKLSTCKHLYFVAQSFPFAFVYGKVAATAVLLEVQRSARSEARKEAAQRREFEVGFWLLIWGYKK